MLGILYSPTKEPLWFISGGLAMIFLAALNLFRANYGGQIRALGWVSFLCNLMCLALFVAIGLSVQGPITQAPQVLVGIILVAVLVHFSVKQMMSRG